jgi:hypothetical protein
MVPAESLGGLPMSSGEPRNRIERVMTICQPKERRLRVNLGRPMTPHEEKEILNSEVMVMVMVMLQV